MPFAPQQHLKGLPKDPDRVPGQRQAGLRDSHGALGPGSQAQALFAQLLRAQELQGVKCPTVSALAQFPNALSHFRPALPLRTSSSSGTQAAVATPPRQRPAAESWTPPPSGLGGLPQGSPAHPPSRLLPAISTELGMGLTGPRSLPALPAPAEGWLPVSPAVLRAGSRSVLTSARFRGWLGFWASTAHL